VTPDARGDGDVKLSRLLRRLGEIPPLNVSKAQYRIVRSIRRV
jgi:hypothetical protein